MNYKVEFNEEKQKGFQTGDASDVESQVKSTKYYSIKVCGVGQRYPKHPARLINNQGWTANALVLKTRDPNKLALMKAAIFYHLIYLMS